MRRNDKVSLGIRTVAACLFAAVQLAATAISAEAQQFSADLVAKKDGTTTAVGTLRVSEQKARIEAAAFPDGFFLIDSAKPAALFVRPAARVFMDARQSSQLTRMFVPVDPDQPCRQWQAIAQLAAPNDEATWHCERDGEETIAGRRTDVYRVSDASGFGFIGWVDRARGFPLQVKTADGTVIAADHIRDEPQAAQAFELPAGLRKFDPQALIRRIQQSDVWVAPPDSE
ncbi:hypothetical protein [Bradyrhizobium sp. CCBAU 51753]|uniref:hypothetical protein n=1 Tax=Bradyrhizobium sp. CCBAU 51753 TaxID=1325100 RepID=UPI001FEE461F|nr:hypothetical protein [Bradyrhizobium sp. CCBAU 51753]